MSKMSEATAQQFKVGDELAFDSRGWCKSWTIYKIEKITPSGRMLCGPYWLNPDLTVRGREPYSSSPYKAYSVTDKIRADVLRHSSLYMLQRKIKWDLLPTKVLSQIIDIAEKAMPEVKEEAE
jgi:hypothetical protein